MISKTARHGMLAAFAGLSLVLLAGCDQSQRETTVGQKVDAAIEKGREVAADVKAEGRTALNDAETRLREDGPKVEDRAREAAAKAGTLIDDTAITAKITARLARDLELSAREIQVQTRSGVVTLSGPVPSAAARERAVELVRGVEGVVGVENFLVARSG